MKLKISLLTCALLLTAIPAEAHECRPKTHAKIPKIKGKTYHEARQVLIKAGWKPLVLPKKPGSHSVEAFESKGYIEIEDCAGTGLAPCLAAFQDRHANILKVVTLGEEAPDEGIFARVDQTYFVCKDKP